jgi:hypothetical protein
MTKSWGWRIKEFMQKFWDLSKTSGKAQLPVTVLSELLKVNALSDSQPILQAINQVSGVDYISMVEHSTSGRKPIQLAHSAKEFQAQRDLTKECFDRYCNLYFRQDPVTHLLDQMHGSHMQNDQVAALYVMREDIPNHAWKRDIYERENLPDRLSFMFSPEPARRLAVNLYRSAERGPFTHDELEALLPIGSLIAQVFKSHVGSHKTLTFGSSTVELEKKLEHLAPGLSPRERAVCARIAEGMSVDGIAVDLNVAPSTIMTLRKRAYAKLHEQGGPGDRLRLVRWLAHH